MTMLRCKVTFFKGVDDKKEVAHEMTIETTDPSDAASIAELHMRPDDDSFVVDAQVMSPRK